MNIIQMRDAIDFYNDRFKSPRFDDANYISALNDAIDSFIKDRFNNTKQVKRYSFQEDEKTRRELYTLITKTTLVPVSNVITYPNDYGFFVELYATTDGTTAYARPTNYNELGPLQEDPFRKPKKSKPYYVETSTGLEVFSAGTVTTTTLIYLKMPNSVSMGKETDKISAGAAVLTNGTSYVAYEDSYQGTTLYPSGTVFTSVGTALTSGTVIPVSVTTNCDLPETTHDEICKMAAEIMQLTIEDYNKSNLLMQNNNQS